MVVERRGFRSRWSQGSLAERDMVDNRLGLSSDLDCSWETVEPNFNASLFGDLNEPVDFDSNVG